ncbi:hypothetical protein [Sediminibacillus halophilus]|uniref:Uncharacterized protein n=1 Tax=Sediminibacillus halophilus TaxID=482461 RepID=A0A1G9QTT3_9BACI|nr:hypothetical protein [Sediminibacillus halophilus]SDM14363.1 hypothetical protein SAMN05216244_1659 [Sediminibacillus halophilus]
MKITLESDVILIPYQEGRIRIDIIGGPGDYFITAELNDQTVIQEGKYKLPCINKAIRCLLK